MSKFNIFRDVPVEQMALRSEIANRSGHHFYFQNLKDITSETSFPRPGPKAVGFTFRVFAYCVSLNGWTEVKLDYQDTFRVSARVRTGFGGRVDAPTRGKTNSSTTIRSNIYIKEGQFFSLAVRLENEKLLKAFFNKTAYHQENYGWSMIYYDGLTPKLKNVTNYIHSIHCTIETDAGDSPWDWNSLFWNRPVPLHTWVTYTLRVHTDNPPDLYITIGGQTSYFTIRGVKRGQLLMYTVRLFTNGYLVANDFNPNKKYSFLKVDNPDYIKATFGERVDIFKVEAMMPEVSIS
ncbi:uncharacterized protein LOC144104987 isoform X1 [Amblyomma americanum]